VPGLPGKGGWVRRACVPGGCPGMGCSCGWNANNFPCRSYGWWGSTLLGPEGISTRWGGPLVGSGGGPLSHRTARVQNPCGVVVVGSR
jgi:hypothetical protein